LDSSPKDPEIKFSVFSMVGRIVPSIIEVSIGLRGLISLSVLFLLASSADNQDIILIAINIIRLRTIVPA
jgi:hypothetical protein